MLTLKIIIFMGSLSFSNFCSEDDMPLNDQRNAESIFLKSGTIARAKKLISKITSMSWNHICRMDEQKFLQICVEITISHRTPSALEAAYTLINTIPGECKQYNVKIIALKNPSTNCASVWVRQCPTSPELWISEGTDHFSIFVYVRETPWSDNLVFENYIPVVYSLLRS